MADHAINAKNGERLLFGVILAYGAVSLFLGLGAAFVVSVFFLVIYFILKTKPGQDERFIAMVLILAFLVRIAVMCLLHLQSYNEGFGGFISGDDRLYSLKAVKIALQWQGLPYNSISDIGGVDYGVNPFTYMLALFYRLFGASYIDSKFINCLIGALTPLAAYFLAGKIFSNREAKITMLITAFYPSLVHWSIANLRDPLIILIGLVLLYIFASPGKGPEMVIKIFFAVLLMVLLKNLQILNFYALLASLTIYAMYRMCEAVKSKIAVAALTIFLIAYSIFGYEILKPRILKQLNYVISRNSQLYITGRTGYQIYNKEFVDKAQSGILDPVGMAKAYSKGLTYFILSPFPWAMQSMNQLMAYPQVILWYALILLALYGFREGFRRDRYTTVLILSFLVVGVSLWSIAEANIGAAFRHRDFLAPFIFIYASCAIVKAIDFINRRNCPA